ncbi:hemolysin D [Pleomorphomonas diazotrophica]|uniref:Hemolysin D n=1 Tax=Pleomorphomonas diazotrophica TaxID=1166257 RepID=A0A1I4V2E7_9HYPH|nr:HlyD family secretion protein [Pleomorphomonas diazotrophica]PKR88703.1 hemolysin D [Pleomorphomonas diazotrophica]SFM95358.1 membrane fusion protein, multidrug efflux system [Pleomorphomonas diazotrophica]
MAKREANAAHDSDGSEATVTQIRPAAEAAPKHVDEAPEAPRHAAGDGKPAAQPKKPRSVVSRLVLIALLGTAAWFGGKTGYAWWTDGRFLVTTDDAYVAADITTLAAKASGYVTEVMVADNQAVKKGEVIARVDSGDYVLAVAQAENALAGNLATIARIDKQIAAGEAQVAQAKAGVASAQASLESKDINFARQSTLVTNKVSAQSQLDDARTDRDAARATVASAEAAVAVAEANIEVLRAQKAEAEATGRTLQTALDKAKRDLSFTEIRAPVDGVVGNKALEVGTYVTPGQQLASLVATGSAHIEANYKETQLAELTPGETVRITVDALGEEETILGKVESLSPATGSVFSLLPANNATGNFTKVVQRLPVRISVPADVATSGKLRPGLSVVVAADPRTAPTNTQTAGIAPAS